MLIARQHWFSILISLIAAVSLIDTALIVIFSDSIGLLERNPMGQWLLQINHGGIAVFVLAKVAGTLIVLTTLYLMRRCRSRKTIPVTTSLAAWQVGLLTYLTFA